LEDLSSSLGPALCDLPHRISGLHYRRQTSLTIDFLYVGFWHLADIDSDAEYVRYWE